MVMMISENPTVAVVGPGAIGTTLAAALHEAGRTPTVCGRTAREHLELRFDSGRIVLPGPVLTDPTEIKNTFDLVLVAVKSTQVEAAAPWFSALCSEDDRLRAAKWRRAESTRRTILVRQPGAALGGMVSRSTRSGRLGMAMRQTAPDVAGHTGHRRSAGGAARHTMFGRHSGGFHVRGMAKASTECCRGFDGSDRSPRWHVLPNRRYQALSDIPTGMS